ncbi:MAG: hypothetical protein J2P29_08595, partial [Actinobacteria bacterium]|nr:hypothetical protein [Actinomycetota bacterium]
IGLRARHARWIAWAGIYAALLVGWVALDSAANASDTVVGVWVLMLILTWIGGGTHAIAISNDAVRRIRRRHDPAIEAAEAKVNLRAEGNS